MPLISSWIKSRRAQNDTDWETWIEGGVTPTLNAFDNATETRATVVVYSVREDAKANNFSATETDTALALQANRPSVQSHHAQLFIAEPVSVRRLTPQGGTVLDPFMGSGSTGKACAYEGFDFIGIDQSPEYVEIARARIAYAQNESATEIKS